MEGQYERVSQSRELLYSVPAALCEEIARAATEECRVAPLLKLRGTAAKMRKKKKRPGAPLHHFWRRGAPPQKTRKEARCPSAPFLVFSDTAQKNAKTWKNWHFPGPSD